MKDYVESVNELNRWLTVWRQRLRLRSAMPYGALVETACNQLDQAMVRHWWTVVFTELYSGRCNGVRESRQQEYIPRDELGVAAAHVSLPQGWR